MARDISLKDFVDLEYGWKEIIRNKSFELLTFQAADEYTKHANIDLKSATCLAKKVLSGETTVVLAGEEVTNIPEKVQCVIDKYKVIQEDRFLLCFAPTSFGRSQKVQEKEIFKQCYRTFIDAIPDLSEGSKCIMLEVHNEEPLLSTIQKFIIENNSFHMRHIILFGHGDKTSYCLEVDKHTKKYVNRDEIIKTVDEAHNKHLTGDLEKLTKTVVVFCMCYGHGHCPADHPATEIVTFTTNEKKDIFITSDQCFELQQYAKLVTERMGNNSQHTQVVSGSQ